MPTEVSCLSKWRGGGEEEEQEEQKDQEELGECEVKEEGVADGSVVDAEAAITTPIVSEGTEESRTVVDEAQNTTSSSVAGKVRYSLLRRCKSTWDYVHPNI